MATQVCRALGWTDADFMPQAQPAKLIPLDSTEEYFRRRAERKKRGKA